MATPTARGASVSTCAGGAIFSRASAVFLVCYSAHPRRAAWCPRSTPAATTPVSAAAVRPGSVWGGIVTRRPIRARRDPGALTAAGLSGAGVKPSSGATLPTFSATNGTSRVVTTSLPTIGWCGGLVGPSVVTRPALAIPRCSAITAASPIRSPARAGPYAVLTRAARRKRQFRYGVRSF